MISNYLFAGLNYPVILKANKFLAKSQYFSLEELNALQQKKLKKLIEYSKGYVPYYKKAFKNLSPNDDFSFLEQEALELNLILQKIISTMKNGK